MRKFLFLFMLLAFPSISFGESPLLELENVYFEAGSTEIHQEDLIGLSVIANFLREMPADVTLWVEGHADERGSAESNLALGWKRAEAVREYLIQLGGNPGKIATDSYGEEKPFVFEHTEEAWAKNRRVEFSIRID